MSIESADLLRASSERELATAPGKRATSNQPEQRASSHEHPSQTSHERRATSNHHQSPTDDRRSTIAVHRSPTATSTGNPQRLAGNRWPLRATSDDRRPPSAVRRTAARDLGWRLTVLGISVYGWRLTVNGWRFLFSLGDLEGTLFRFPSGK